MPLTFEQRIQAIATHLNVSIRALGPACGLSHGTFSAVIKRNKGLVVPESVDRPTIHALAKRSKVPAAWIERGEGDAGPLSPAMLAHVESAPLNEPTGPAIAFHRPPQFAHLLDPAFVKLIQQGALPDEATRALNAVLAFNHDRPLVPEDLVRFAWVLIREERGEGDKKKGK